MLKRCHRVGDRRLFAVAARRRGQIRHPLLSLSILTETQAPGPRFALVVSKKVCRHATGRNRLRRQLYTVIRQKFLGHIPAGWVCILYVRPTAAEVDFPTLEAALDSVFGEALANAT